MVGYNVQSAVTPSIISIVSHEVTNVGSDRSQLSRMSEQARAAIWFRGHRGCRPDRGYYSRRGNVTCEQAGITVYLPKPMTSGLLAKGRFGKQDFVYDVADDVYLCPAGEQLTYHYTMRKRARHCGATGPTLAKVRAEEQVHNRQRAADLTMGAEPS